jgi:hypothetical protein
MLSKLSIYMFIIVLLVSLFFVLSTQAQPAPDRAATAASSTRTQLATTTGKFSPAVQQALEAGDTRKAVKLCGAACKSSAAGSITTGEKTGTADYQCQNGNCACTSIPDCVAMSEICAPGTTGCNDYGCTCAEK